MGKAFSSLSFHIFIIFNSKRMCGLEERMIVPLVWIEVRESKGSKVSLSFSWKSNTLFIKLNKFVGCKNS